MTKRKSTIDERLAAVKEYTEAGKPYEQIARERGFSYRQVVCTPSRGQRNKSTKNISSRLQIKVMLFHGSLPNFV